MPNTMQQVYSHLTNGVDPTTPVVYEFARAVAIYYRRKSFTEVLPLLASSSADESGAQIDFPVNRFPVPSDVDLMGFLLALNEGGLASTIAIVWSTKPGSTEVDPLTIRFQVQALPAANSPTQVRYIEHNTTEVVVVRRLIKQMV